MDLRRIEGFLAVLEEGTVSGAAVRRHLTQPALSRQIASLESDLGLELFHRASGRLQPTVAGELFAARVRDLVDHARRVRDLATSLAEGRPTQLEVAAPGATLNELVAPFVARLGPGDVVITAHEHESLGSPYEALQRADLAIIAGPPPADLAHHTLGEVPLCAQVRGDHAWGSRRPARLDVADLAAEPLVLQTRDNVSRVQLDDVFAGRGLRPRLVIETSAEQMVQALAATGRGIGVLTESPRYGLQAVRLYDGDDPLTLTLHAVWDPTHYAATSLFGLARRLADFLTEVTVGMAQRYGW